MNADKIAEPLNPPWYLRKTTFVTVAGALSGFVALADPFVPLVPDNWRPWLAAICLACTQLAPHFARHGAIVAAEKVAERAGVADAPKGKG